MKKIFTLLTLVCCAVLGWAQTAVFVASDGNDNNNGSTWALAKKTIAAGITAAGENGTVYVKAGSYGISAQLVVRVGVSVKGGYGLASTGTDTTQRELPGTNNRWENASICTIITGNGNHRIASVSGLLEGCILRRGYTNAMGGGAYIDGGIVRYCVIRECDAINESTLEAEGGGVYIINGGTLSNSVITECRGDRGPAASGGNGTLVNNTITRNWPTHCGTVADYDGNVYTTVVIGQQCWTKQNLRTTHYNDGTAIPQGNTTSSTEPFYYINYNIITSTMLTNYGYLYNWQAVMHGAPSSNENPSGVTGICPRGWHVPSDAEWTELTDFVNTLARFRCSGYDGQIAKALSAKSAWTSSNNACEVGNNQGGNNVTMFSAYPVGYFNGSFNAFGNNAYFWSTTNTSSVRYRRLDYNYYGVRNYGESMNLAFSVRCVKQLSNEPIVHTNPISIGSIQSTQATGGGKCYSYGDNSVIYGVCWSTSHIPTIEDPHTTDGTGEGVFTSIITGLTNGVTYYVRAYAISSEGVVYGEEVSFTTDACGDPNNVTDYDGNTYNSVLIGTQCWMKENLRTTHFADGTAISTNSGTSNTVAYWYYPNNNANNAETYGLLYNWSAVMHGSASSNANPSGVQGICPNGWHVPSQSEWQQLVSYVQSMPSYWCDGNSTYIAMSLASETGWNSSSSNCYVGSNPSQQNKTLFSARPAGYRTSSCGGFGTNAEFFSSTEDGSSAYRFLIRDRTHEIGSYSKGYGYSVRCVRDE
jgi:uncharacterized protein (TIGR02145 family)